VRELQHAIERAVILCDSNVLKADDFLLTCPAATQGEELQLQSFNIDDVEKNVIQKALRKHNGNISKAAKELGLTRASLYRRLEKYAL
jgi:transcriptional regulator of acetoin/glycerol metabolism